MAIDVSLKPGTRVRLAGDVVGVTLRDTLGSVVRPDLYDGYYIVRLDSPAIFHHADGSTEDIDELVEAFDNLTIVDSDA
jgi:hypothetical protein